MSGRRLAGNERVRVNFEVLVRNLEAVLDDMSGGGGNATFEERVASFQELVEGIVGGNEFAAAVVTQFAAKLEENGVDSIDVNALALEITNVVTEVAVVAKPSPSPSASPSAPAGAASRSPTPSPSVSATPSRSPTPSATPSTSPAPISFPAFFTSMSIRGDMVYFADRFEQNIREWNTLTWEEGKTYRYYFDAGDTGNDRGMRVPGEDFITAVHPTQNLVMHAERSTLVLYNIDTGRIERAWNLDTWRSRGMWHPFSPEIFMMVDQDNFFAVNITSGAVNTEDLSRYQYEEVNRPFAFNTDASFMFTASGNNAHLISNNKGDLNLATMQTIELNGTVVGAFFDRQRDRIVALHMNEWGAFDLSTFTCFGTFALLSTVTNVTTAEYSFALAGSSPKNLLAIASGPQVLLYHLDTLTPTGEVLARHKTQVTEIHIHPTRPLIFTVAVNGKHRQADVPFDDDDRDDDDWGHSWADDDYASFDRVIMENFIWPGPYSQRSFPDGPAPSPEPWVERSVLARLVDTRKAGFENIAVVANDAVAIALNDDGNFTVYSVPTGEKLVSFRDNLEGTYTASYDFWNLIMLPGANTRFLAIRILGENSILFAVFRPGATPSAPWVRDEQASFNVTTIGLADGTSGFFLSPTGTHLFFFSGDSHTIVSLATKRVVHTAANTFMTGTAAAWNAAGNMLYFPTSEGVFIFDVQSPHFPNHTIGFAIDDFPEAMACDPVRPRCGIVFGDGPSSVLRIFTADEEFETVMEWPIGSRVGEIIFSTSEDLVIVRGAESDRIAFVDRPSENRTFTQEDDEFGTTQISYGEWNAGGNYWFLPDWPTLPVTRDDDDEVLDLALTPNGKYLLASSYDEVILIQMWIHDPAMMSRARLLSREQSIAARMLGEAALAAEEAPAQAPAARATKTKSWTKPSA